MPQLLVADSQISDLQTVDRFTDLYYRYCKSYVECSVTSSPRN